ncbi:MAG: hypothetical protein AVDCRST_MAG83-1696 [uncultured Arthrobacter sp.]|uniref:Uncharacterized protein n=1 Tax=uncultured Arthrobacter sp. TaxID=114050 RepID=A0A6J4I7A1_9MICC|nr:hypothetical protein [uncultured Arthrobacter sp.]CAA9242214.1 MAG: hypothetical protein AVDCRST_MAG83-1696 [uncultured Arthrobacter sp.]
MNRTTPETRDAACNEYLAGAEIADLAARYYVARSTVHGWLSAAGILRRRGVVEDEDAYAGGWVQDGWIRRPIEPERRSA